MKKFLLCSVLALSACGYKVEPVPNTDAIKVEALGSIGFVQEVTLKDGTKCAVLIGSQRGGISCNWKNE